MDGKELDNKSEIKKVMQAEKPKSTKRKCPFKVVDNGEANGKKQLSVNLKNEDSGTNAIEELFGSPNLELASETVLCATAALPGKGFEVMKHNLIYQALADQQPKDAHEARLTLQATVLYTQAMDFLSRARDVLF